MATDTPNTVDKALASLRSKPSDRVERDTTLATMSAVSYTDMAANNPANPKSPLFNGHQYSD